MKKKKKKRKLVCIYIESFVRYIRKKKTKMHKERSHMIKLIIKELTFRAS